MIINRLSLLERFKQGEFTVSVQVDPPPSGRIDEFIKMIAVLIENGVSIVDINSSRRVSHDSVQLAVALSQMGLETIPHVTTRDSSINGLVNQVLAAYELGGVRNFLIITGDPYEASQAIIPFHGVFQTDAIGAIRAINEHLRKRPETALNIALAAAINQNETDLEREGKRVTEKISSGTDFFMSQPVFDKAQLANLVKFYRSRSQNPLLVGIWPLIHIKRLEALWNGKITGVVLPEEIYMESKAFGNREDLLGAWGIEKALELIQLIKSQKSAQGVYIVAPARNPLSLLPLIQRLKTVS